MPYLEISLTGSSPLPATTSSYSISMTSAPIGYQWVRLSKFYAEGLISSAPLFIDFENQASSTINGNPNNTRGFPLFFNSFPAAYTEYQQEIFVSSGDDLWNQLTSLTVNIKDATGNPGIFSRLIIWLEYTEPIRRNVEYNGSTAVAEKETSERVARNNALDYRNYSARHWIAMNSNTRTFS